MYICKTKINYTVWQMGLYIKYIANLIKTCTVQVI